MALDQTAPVTLLVRLLSSDSETGIHLSVMCGTEDGRLSADAAEFVVRFWWETPDIVRASITNIRSGRVAMVQGNDALRKLAEEARLGMEVR